MAEGNRVGMLHMFVVLTLFCSACQSVTVTTRLRDKFNARTSGSEKSCVPVFEEKYPKIHSEFATPFLKAKTEEDCQNACVTDMRCVSYQIDTKPGRVLCWLQLDKAHLVLDNMIDSPNVTEYILVSRCGDLVDRRPTIERESCIPAFEIKNPGWASRKSGNFPDAKSEDECKATCVAIPTCVSYQIDRKSDSRLISCWIQYNEQKLTKDQLFQSDTITEYVLVDRCPKFPVTSGSCIPVFDEKYPMLTSGRATPLPKVRTEEDCKNACVTDMRCVAYQIDTNADRALCWIQLDKANLELDNMLEMVVKTVTEYILVNRCSDPEQTRLTIVHDLCFPAFEIKNPGWISRKATNIPDVKTEGECKAACVSVEACVSYQTERKLLGAVLCWLQYNEQKLTKDKMLQSDTRTEYVLVDRCPKFTGLVVTTESPTTCLPVFDIKNPGWVSRQATNIPDAKTEDECKATCVAAPACVSYQIELKPDGWSFLCYLQYIEQNLNKDQLSRNDAIIEYVLVRRCETTTENPEKECYVTMKPSMFGQLSANATLEESAKEERACVAACIAKRDCISVQFKVLDKSWLCLLQNNFQAFKPENLMYHPNVTEYVITKRCEKTNACSRGFPLKRWGPIFNFRKRGFFGKPKSFEDDEEDIGAGDHHCEIIVQRVNYGLSTTKAVPFKPKQPITTAECIAACAADKVCISAQYQYHPSNETFDCFLQNDTKAFDPKKLLYRPNVKEFIITKRCSGNDLCSAAH